MFHHNMPLSNTIKYKLYHEYRQSKTQKNIYIIYNFTQQILYNPYGTIVPTLVTWITKLKNNLRDATYQGKTVINAVQGLTNDEFEQH